MGKEVTTGKILSVCALYRDVLRDTIKRWSSHDIASYPHLPHALEMLSKIEQFALADRREKAFRWLGFVQGVLWCRAIFTIDQLKEHNMPDGETFEGVGK